MSLLKITHRHNGPITIEAECGVLSKNMAQIVEVVNVLGDALGNANKRIDALEAEIKRMHEQDRARLYGVSNL